MASHQVLHTLEISQESNSVQTLHRIIIRPSGETAIADDDDVGINVLGCRVDIY